jgi:predicted acylesterase/phospholipase RssA
MPFFIELMSIGSDAYPLLDRSAKALNSIQSEFVFRTTSPSEREPGLTLQRTEYKTEDIWTFLRNHKQKYHGERLGTIAFVAQPLASARLRNIFGAHEGDEGLAVVTTSNMGRYVREDRRYCCYYLVRYALSFINPTIRSHEDQERKKCYFHRKIYKPDILLSMDSGWICDQCWEQLDNPTGGARRLSARERAALQTMLTFVANEHPHALVVKGGGVKGLAFAGALLELEDYFYFDRHVGTSAGAIAAILLAAGYTPTELRELLLKKNFRDFLDAPFWKVPINLLTGLFCYPGETFREWMDVLLTKKVKVLSQVRMKDLDGALVYASRRGGTIRFDSSGQRQDASAAFAARCSMSIPFFFQPKYVDDRRVFDGGMRNNFPLDRFLKDHPGTHFIGIYLGKPDHRNRVWFLSELLDIVLEGEERETVDANRDNIVVIDTSPIGTVDFSMTDAEKQFLLLVGRAAALRRLYERKIDDGPSKEKVEEAEREAEASREAIIRMRQRRRARRTLLVLLIVLAAATIYMLRSAS